MADCLYGERVAELLRSMRMQAGMSPEAFANAISEEIGDRLWGPQVSLWEVGSDLPPADVFLAAQTIAGTLAADIDLHPRSGYRRGRPRRPRRNEIDLPEAAGPLQDYVYAQEAAVLLDLSRPSLYHFMATGSIQGYRIGKRTAFRMADVQAMARRRAHGGGRKRQAAG